MDTLKNIWAKTNRWHRVLFIFLIVELRLVPSRQYGFQCNDPALAHPFTGDTISWKWLLAVVVFLPLIVLLLVERLYHKDEGSAKSKQQALCWYKEYLFGVLLNLTIVQTLKILVGAPRPHFFDSCYPKEADTCVGTEYITKYTCQKAHWISQSDKSFPSGHTSLALHTGVFIAYYLHRRTKHLNFNVILTVQLMSVASAVYCALSRITDRRHHWWDVIAGAAIAVPVLFYTTSCLCKNFNCQSVENEV